MRIKSWSEKSKYKKICSEKVDIRFLEDFKQGYKKPTLKILSRNGLRKENILLGIFRKRQRFNEIHTVKSVENCQNLILKEIERFFDQKEKTIDSSFLSELINGRKQYSHVLNNNDLTNIYIKIEKMILIELFEQFKNPIVWQLKAVNYNERISDVFAPVQEYQKTKRRTILISSCMETLCRRTLSDAVDSLIKSSLISKLVCNIDISTILLPTLGIDSTLEAVELEKELSNRVRGALYSIKVGLFQEINSQIANIFFKTHDMLSDSKFEHKINLLEAKIAKEEIYETNLLEA